MIREWLREPTAELLDAAAIAGGDKVLDVAAGAGDQTLDIVERIGASGEVWVTDVSERILGYARRTLEPVARARLNFVVADAQALGLDGAGFDAAVCRLGLMFCASPVAALTSMRRALRPGGRMAALVFSTPDANPCIQLTVRTATRHAGRAPADPFAPGALFSLGRPDMLRQLLDDAGFVSVEVRSIEAPFRLDRPAQYVEFVRTSGSPVIEMLRDLDAESQAAAWDDIERQLARYSDSTGWTGPNELLLCSGASA